MHLCQHRILKSHKQHKEASRKRVLFSLSLISRAHVCTWQGKSSFAPVVPTLLPHLHALDTHCSSILPRRQPVILCLPEIELGTGTLVDPGLAALAILEPAVCAADGHVEDEIEVLVKGRRVAFGVLPGIVQTRAVGVGEREATVVPERLVKVRVHDLQETSVDVGEDVLFRPLDIGLATSELLQV